MTNTEQLALSLWWEQYAAGLVDDQPTFDGIADWVENRTYPISLLTAAAAGDVAALVEVRAEAGLRVIE